jgi:hypothetical protein
MLLIHIHTHKSFMAKNILCFRNARREHRRERRHKIGSGSEASFNTYSSRGTYGYESETFEEARQLRKARSGAGLNVDSGDEDCR